MFNKFQKMMFLTSPSLRLVKNSTLSLSGIYGLFSNYKNSKAQSYKRAPKNIFGPTHTQFNSWMYSNPTENKWGNNGGRANKNIKKQGILLLFRLLLAGSVAFFADKLYTQHKFLNKYRHQQLIIPENIVENTQMEKYFEKQIRDTPMGVAYLHVGSPQSGKTTYIKNIINKITKQNKLKNINQDIYYFSLRCDDDIEQKVKELKKLCQTIQSTTNKKTWFRFIIDDIQNLKLSNQYHQVEKLIMKLQD